MACVLCEKRPPKRYCPAKAASICAVCCGTEREVTIDCPSDCAYLIAARKWDAEHRKPVPPGEIPFYDVRFSPDVIHERRPVVSGLGYTILKVAAENRLLDDSDVIAALTALAETFRTLDSGLYYEKPPEGPVRVALYTQLAEFLKQFNAAEAERAGWATLKNTEAFYVLVFLARAARAHSSGRPKSRAFLDFIRAQYPSAAAAPVREEPRIIAP